MLNKDEYNTILSHRFHAIMHMLAGKPPVRLVVDNTICNKTGQHKDQCPCCILEEEKLMKEQIEEYYVQCASCGIIFDANDDLDKDGNRQSYIGNMYICPDCRKEHTLNEQH